MMWSSSAGLESHDWQPRSAQIEMTSYVLLALFRRGSFVEGIDLMKWLSEQRNYLGGYGTTQVTPFSVMQQSDFRFQSDFPVMSLSLVIIYYNVSCKLVNYTYSVYQWTSKVFSQLWYHIAKNSFLIQVQDFFFIFFFCCLLPSQDTVIALQALAYYAAFSGANAIDLRLSISNPTASSVSLFGINSTNFQAYQSQEVREPSENPSMTNFWTMWTLLSLIVVIALGFLDLCWPRCKSQHIHGRKRICNISGTDFGILLCSNYILLYLLKNNCFSQPFSKPAYQWAAL